MKKRTRNPDGYYKIDGKGLYISVTTVTKILEKVGLHPWIAGTACDHYEENLIRPLVKGEITLEDLAEMDPKAFRQAACDRHKDEAKEAAGLGTRVHEALDLYHKTGAWPIEPIVREKFEQVLQWEAESHLHVLHSEVTVHSDTFKYAGTLDLECIIDNPVSKHGLMDWKTSSGFYPEWKLQLAGLVAAHEEMTGQYLDFGGIGLIDKKIGKFKPYIFSRAELIVPEKMFNCLVQYCHLKDWGKE